MTSVVCRRGARRYVRRETMRAIRLKAQARSLDHAPQSPHVDMVIQAGGERNFRATLDGFRSQLREGTGTCTRREERALRGGIREHASVVHVQSRVRADCLNEVEFVSVHDSDCEETTVAGTGNLVTFNKQQFFGIATRRVRRVMSDRCTVCLTFPKTTQLIRETATVTRKPTTDAWRRVARWDSLDSRR